MNIKRFHAPTSREALAKARMAFGDGVFTKEVMGGYRAGRPDELIRRK